MKQAAKGYLLKEYGSWSVLIVAYLAGLVVSRGFDWKAVPLFLGLGLLINSKQAFTAWSRRKEDRKSLIIFLGQVIIASAILFAIFGREVPRLLPLVLFPTAYLLMNKFAGEHFFLTEVTGFALISLAAVFAKFLMTGGVDVRFFVAIALYFSAGVFKVKALLRKKPQDRVLAALYVIFAVFVYRGFHIPVIILLPLFDNLVVAAAPYNVKLKTTGWIEVGKSLLFLVLMAALY